MGALSGKHVDCIAKSYIVQGEWCISDCLLLAYFCASCLLHKCNGADTPPNRCASQACPASPGSFSMRMIISQLQAVVFIICTWLHQPVWNTGESGRAVLGVAPSSGRWVATIKDHSRMDRRLILSHRKSSGRWRHDLGLALLRHSRRSEKSKYLGVGTI